MNSLPCICCSSEANSREVTLRNGEMDDLYFCPNCGFEFFSELLDQHIKEDTFENARLASAGLEIPQEEEDFNNGYAQSEEYITRHIKKTQSNFNVLEIGCSSGYFLKRVMDLKQAISCEGLELNPYRASRTRDRLDIPCYESIDEIPQDRSYRFIFMFYVLEYIPEPLSYIKNLIEMLSHDGKLVIYTPNQKDVLKDIWEIEEFKNFFYERQSLNYFTTKSIQELCKNIDNEEVNYKITTHQAYSPFNHLRWFFERKPKSTGIVGGDSINQELIDLMSKEPTVSGDIGRLLEKFDQDYKNILEDNEFGNRILLEIDKYQ
jgi:2-polyprenyl-3-methyl-5-hydroxy-6-metoxy-1,4-benzoquinol methylase